MGSNQHNMHEFPSIARSNKKDIAAHTAHKRTWFR